MKKTLKRIGIIGLICAVLAPFTSFPKVNAQQCTDEKYYLNQYLYLGVTSGYGLLADASGKGYLSTGGKTNYTTYLYTFPTPAEGQELVITDANEVKLDTDTKMELFYSYYLDIYEEVTSSKLNSKVEKKGEYKESLSTDKNYESVTSLLHGYWADDEDRDKTPADWRTPLDNIEESEDLWDGNDSAISIQGALDDAGIDIDDVLEHSYGAAKLTSLDKKGRFSPASSDYRHDFDDYITDLVAAFNEEKIGDDTAFENLLIEDDTNTDGKPEYYFNTNIVRRIFEDGLEVLKFGFSEPKEEGSKDYKYFIISNEEHDRIKEGSTTSYDAAIEIADDFDKDSNIRDICKTENGCYIHEVEEEDVDIYLTQMNYYWPALYRVEYKLCSTVTAQEPTPEQPTPVTEKWTLKYDGNGSNVVNLPGKQEGEVNKEVTVTSEKPRRDGYTFDGWNTEANGSGTPYKAGDKVGNSKANAEVTLFAQWKEVGPAEQEETGVISYVLGFAAVGLVAGGIYLVSKKKNLFKQI